MKILHTADLHLASPLTTRLSADKIKIRRRELMMSFLNTVEIAEGQGVSAFIIAGDLFDSENVSLSVIKDTLAIIRSHPALSFYYLCGNHEGNVLIESSLPLPQNLFIFGDEWTYFNHHGITIAGRCRHSADMFAALTLDEGKCNMIVLHGVLADRTDGIEQIGRKDIELLPIDYLALGHYHSFTYEEIGKRCKAVYPGIPEGRGFDEADEKGVCMIEFDGYTLSPRFLKTAKRIHYIVDITIGDGYGTYETDQLVSYATRIIPRESLVRVVLRGERAPFESFDVDSFKDRYSQSFFYIEFVDKTRIHFSPEEYMLDKTLKGEFIRGVMADDTLSEEQKEKIIIMGLRALHGESFD